MAGSTGNDACAQNPLGIGQLGALEQELLLASQMRAQHYLHAALMHDLRAPLNALEITMELLTESIGGAQIEEMSPERYVKMLRDELARLNRTLRTVLEGGVPLREEAREFDLMSIVQELELLLKPQARRQRVNLHLQLPTRIVPVLGRRESVKQAILNVLINALEAMPKGGDLRIELALHGDKAVVLVRDTGAGLPADAAERIYQAHFSTKGSGGMGLYVARLVLEAHGGSVEIEAGTEPGAGFAIALPLVQKPASAVI